MSLIKNHFHDQICQGQQKVADDMDLDRQHEEDSKEAEHYDQEAEKAKFIEIGQLSGRYPM